MKSPLKKYDYTDIDAKLWEIFNGTFYNSHSPDAQIAPNYSIGPIPHPCVKYGVYNTAWINSETPIKDILHKLELHLPNCNVDPYELKNIVYEIKEIKFPTYLTTRDEIVEKFNKNVAPQYGELIKLIKLEKGCAYDPWYRNIEKFKVMGTKTYQTPSDPFSDKLNEVRICTTVESKEVMLCIFFGDNKPTT